MNSEWKKFNSLVISTLAVGVSFLVGMGVGYDSRPEIEKVTSL